MTRMLEDKQRAYNAAQVRAMRRWVRSRGGLIDKVRLTTHDDNMRPVETLLIPFSAGDWHASSGT